MTRYRSFAALLSGLALVLLIPCLLAAQGMGQGKGQGQGGPPPGVPAGSSNPLKNVQVFEGVLTEVLVEYGAKYPVVEITIANGDVLPVRLAPVWYLNEIGLTIEVLESYVSQEVTVVALVKDTGDEIVYHAISIAIGDDTLWELRSESGKPGWIGSEYKKPKDPKGHNTSSIQEISGDVLSLDYSLQTNQLRLRLRADDGYVYRLYLGPPEDLMAGGFAIREGNRVRVRYALAGGPHTGIAYELTNRACVATRLRDEEGNFLWPDFE